MAYMCEIVTGKECDGCGECKKEKEDDEYETE